MGETALDKSKVTVRIPKRFWTNGKPEYVEWQEFKLKTRLMPNGYRVTLAVVILLDTDGAPCAIIGASACSPHDSFSAASAQQRSIGRARQSAFRYLHDPLRKKMFHTLLYDPDLVADVSVECFKHGCATKDVLTCVHDGTDATEGSLYDLVARNAERNALLQDISVLRSHFGYRFDITVRN